MKIPVNQFGIPQFPHDDARRLFVLAYAIELLERPTPCTLEDLTGMQRDTVDAAVHILCEQYGMTIPRFGDIYRIASWGSLLNKEGIQQLVHSYPHQN